VTDVGRVASRERADIGVCAASARGIVVLDEQDNVVYTQLVPEITQEPDYDGAVEAAR
jgi:thiol peroxidase